MINIISQAWKKSTRSVSEAFRLISKDMPGTKLFRKHYLQRIVLITQYRLNLFDKLSAIDEDTKSRIRKLVRNSEKRLSVVMVIQILFMEFIDRMALSISLTWLLLLGTISALVMQQTSYPISDLMLIHLCSIIGSIIFNAIILAPAIIMRKLHGYLYFYKFATVWIICIWLTSAGVLFQQIQNSRLITPNLLTSILTTTLWNGIGLFTIILACYFFVVAPVKTILIWRRERYHPDIEITHQLLTILSKLENGDWSRLEFRQELLPAIENVARIIQYEIPKKLKSGDELTDSWTVYTFIRLASALRRLKKWVVTPKIDTKQRLIEHITDYLICIYSGNWDKLEQCDPEVITQKQWILRTLNALKTMTLSIIPILVYGFIQQTPIAISEPTSTYIAVATGGWAVLSFMLVLDPSLNSKVQVAKEFINLFSPTIEKRD